MTDPRQWAWRKWRIGAVAFVLASVEAPGAAQGGRMDGAPLTSLSQVRLLPREQAAAPRPVQLQARVALWDAGAQLLYLEEDQAGARVRLRGSAPPELATGSVVRVQGAAVAGDFAPEIAATNISVLGFAPLPPPPAASLNDLRSGVFEARRVRVFGLLESLDIAARKGVLAFGADAVAVEFPAEADLAPILGRVGGGVALVGAVVSTADRAHRLTGVALACAGPQWVEPAPAASAPTFDLPLTPIGGVFRFDPVRSAGARVRIRGVVTALTPGGGFFVQDDTGGVHIAAAPRPDIRPGLLLEIAGEPVVTRDGFEVRLDARRIEGTQTLPKPAPWYADSEPEVLDGLLISLRGTVLAPTHALNGGAGGWIVQSGDRRIELQYAGSPWPGAAPRSDSSIQAAGVLAVRRGAPAGDAKLSLYLRAPEDLVTLRDPAGPLQRFAWGALGVGAAVGATGLVWAYMLRRRVEFRTAELTLANQALAGEIETRCRVEADLRQANAAAATANHELARANRDLSAAHAEARRLAEAATEASRAKSSFLANVSHEIRTPMNGVLGMANLLLESRLSREQRELAELARNSAEGLIGIINDLLDFSKIEAGRMTFESAPFSVYDLAEYSCAILAGRAHEKELEFNLVAPAGLPEPLLGDPGRIRQVLLNLLGNAVKFTTAGEVEARVEAIDSSDQSALVRFSVRDTGIGIAPHDLSRLFQPFGQLDDSMARRFGGTGLGLAISRELVRGMGGEIRVDSAVGRGSTFSFELRFPVPPDATRRQTTRFQHREAVLVDPSPAARESLAAVLGALGIQCKGFADWPSAERHCDDLGPAAIPNVIFLALGGSEAMPDAVVWRNRPGWQATRWFAISKNGHPVDPALFTGVASKPFRRLEIERLLAPMRQSGAGAPAARGERPALEHPDNRPLKLLVAEDNPVNQRVISQQLVRLGCSADLVSNGLEAVGAAKDVRYDAILMDCQMPRMDGYEATREIRRLERESQASHRVQIIAITANAMPGDRDRCLEAGMDDYIAKPVRVDDLRGVLERTVARIDKGAPTA